MAEPAHTASAPALGSRLILTITDIAFGGEGVGRAEGFVVFVPFVAVGEKVEVEVTEVKKHFARARLLQVLEPSPDRVQPRCRYFGACGGCQYQHLAYPAQLELKRKQVADLLERIAHVPARLVAPVVPCPQPYGYRNRIMVRTQWNKPLQRLSVGFLRHDSRLVEDIEQCAIAEPELNRQLQQLRANPPPRGGLKAVLRLPPPGWQVPPDSFFQNNFFMAPELVRVVRECLGQAGTRYLIDAYCGVGFFAIELAGSVEWFVGIELDAQAIRAARLNAVARQRFNGEFREGATEVLLPKLVAGFDSRRTTVVLDPPRTGCRSEAIEALRQAEPAQIIYVSCHPATLARDIQRLCADGLFQVRRIIPLDMFPQTQHVECVADLRTTRRIEPATQ
jgi:tRNA/tmRNA/rRNA uracil-C5-methylase (TrmA/RlmC/RlmD family)